MRLELQGSWTALATPFQDGRIDFDALRRLIERQIAGGTRGLVIGGTTGESATLSDLERRALVEFACGAAARRIPVFAGVGTNATAQSVSLARAAAGAGADGLMVVTPYYNRPTQRGLAQHFGLIAAATELPVMLYNVPSRTAVDLEPATAGEIAEHHSNVVAIKETVCTKERVRALVERTPLTVLCGEDHAVLSTMGWGAKGVVSVLANLLPERVAELVRAASPAPPLPMGDARRAAALTEELAPLIRLLFAEPNPAPLKGALAAAGLCRAELRLPLVPVEPDLARRLGEAFGGAARTR